MVNETVSESELKMLEKLATELRTAYDKSNKDKGYKVWGINEYIQGFTGDLGILAKLIMEKTGWRPCEEKNIDEKIEHELIDCFWSVLVIANLLNVDLANSFKKIISELKTQIETA